MVLAQIGTLQYDMICRLLEIVVFISVPCLIRGWNRFSCYVQWLYKKETFVLFNAIQSNSLQKARTIMLFKLSLYNVLLLYWNGL